MTPQSPTPGQLLTEAPAVRLALEDADALERTAEDADENQWLEWGATMRQAAQRIRSLAALASPAQDEPLGVDLGEVKRLAEAAEADNANPDYFEAVRSLEAFNAAANPSVIKALISHIEKLEGRG